MKTKLAVIFPFLILFAAGSAAAGSKGPQDCLTQANDALLKAWSDEFHGPDAMPNITLNLSSANYKGKVPDPVQSGTVKTPSAVDENLVYVYLAEGEFTMTAPQTHPVWKWSVTIELNPDCTEKKVTPDEKVMHLLNPEMD